jgi:hypothetical protein
MQLKYVEAGDFYLTWRWEHDLGGPQVLALPRDRVRPPLDALSAAVPSPLPGESVSDALRRAFAGALADPRRETGLMTDLAQALIPRQVALEVDAVIAQGRRPHLRIQACAALGRVPWEALRIDDGERLVHAVDTSLLPPATVRHAAGRSPSAWVAGGRGTLVAVVDPAVPGGVLAPVLGAVPDHSPLGAALLAYGDRLRGASVGAVSGVRLDRDTVRVQLHDAARLLYVGHVSGGTHGLDVRMHLSCDASRPGAAAPIGPHRPLAAADLLALDAADAWRFPSRVALIACESGGDASFAEPSGLVTAMHARGAEHVTAARWTLPTDAAFAAVAASAGHRRPYPGAGPVGEGPFSDAVIAVDAAHERADPITALNAWQRVMADEWERSGSLTACPLIWAALGTSWAP